MTAINKEKAVSVPGNADGKLLSLGIRRNRGKIAEVVVFAAVGDGLQIFGIAPVGDADTGDLALLCHIYCLLFLDDGIIGKLIPGDPAVLFDKSDDSFCVGICLRNLIQGLLCKLLSKVVILHIHRSFEVVFASQYRLFSFTNWRIM